jgi:hypothetical protein
LPENAAPSVVAQLTVACHKLTEAEEPTLIPIPLQSVIRRCQTGDDHLTKPTQNWSISTLSWVFTA